MTVQIIEGDCRAVLAGLPAKSVHCCVTSPPYFGLRDYGVDGQIGLERTPDAFVAELVAVFREVRRVLRDDGTLWLNLGDSYNAAGRSGEGRATSQKQKSNRASASGGDNCRPTVASLKGKDLIGIPWMVAFALRADGWYLRQEIIWHKPNPMPESVTDRCTKAHEQIFLLSKSPRYYFDQAAILEPASPNTHARLAQNGLAAQAGSNRVPGKTNGPMKAVARKFDPAAGNKNNASFDAAMAVMPTERNKRSVWTVTTQGFKEAHFATFPPALIEPCIAAGSPAGGVVLDPFGGAGTTGLVADRLGRDAVLVELNPAYAAIARERISGDAPLFGAVAS
jgi:DNA modification methylase